MSPSIVAARRHRLFVFYLAKIEAAGKAPRPIFLDAKLIAEQKKIAAFANQQVGSIALYQAKFWGIFCAFLIRAAFLPPTYNIPSPPKFFPAFSTTQISIL